MPQLRADLTPLEAGAGQRISFQAKPANGKVHQRTTLTLDLRPRLQAVTLKTPMSARRKRSITSLVPAGYASRPSSLPMSLLQALFLHIWLALPM